jgi:hypothetical protein
VCIGDVGFLSFFLDRVDTISQQQPSFIYQTQWWQLSNMFSTHCHFHLNFKDIRCLRFDRNVHENKWEFLGTVL